MHHRFLPLLLAPLLTACPPPDIAVRAAFLGNALAFIPVDSGDSDSLWCWSEGTVVDDSLRPVWQFTGSGTGECGDLFPLYYGRPPDGAGSAIGPARLEPGRLYVLIGDATAGVYGAFSLTRTGNLWTVHNFDPESAGANSVRQAWWQRPRPGEPAPAGPGNEPAARP